MHCWKLPTYFIPMSPPLWSIPHSTTKLWPLGPVYVVASDPGQEMSEGVLLGETDVMELVVVPLEDSEVAELDKLDVEPDCDDDDPTPKLELEVVVLEPSFKSLAPQTAGMFTAEPTALLR
jgi:hypothetical protein